MKISFLTFCLIYTTMGFSQSPILIDGYFSDWEDVNTTLEDTPDTDLDVDLIRFQVTNDEEYLYIHLELNTEIQLIGDLYNHSLFMYIDTDNNSNTGYDAQTNYGTEVGINFKQRFSYFNVTPFSTFQLNSIGILVAPTVTSDEFEIAIPREVVPDNINPLFPSNTIKITFQENNGGDKLPDDGEVFSYEFDNTIVSTFEPLDLEKTSNSHLRMMAFNTLFDGITDSFLQDEYQRILQSIQPQIIGFSECVSSSASQVKSRLDQWLPSSDPNGWYVIKDDYDLVTASLWPFLDSWAEIDRQFPVLIDLPSSYPKDLLFTNSHIKCCDGNDLRQLQVDEYAAFILDAKMPGGDITLEENTPIIYAGDLNLVGFSEQLTTLLTGEIQNTNIYGEGGFLDWDNTPNKDLTPIHTDKNYTFTWQDEASDYTASRIDYIIYSDAVLTAEKSFILNSREMSSDRLLQNNLQVNDSYYASDHFPVIMDFSFVDNLSVSTIESQPLAIYPNPSTGRFSISGLKMGSSIEIYSSVGKQVFQSLANGATQSFDFSKMNSGVYCVIIQEQKVSQYFLWVKK